MATTNGAFDSATATVLNTATTSGPIKIGGAHYVGIIVPSTFDGTTMTFTVCDTQNGTYMPLTVAAGTAVTYTTAASKAITLSAEIQPWLFFKIVCGTAQTGDTVFTITMKG